MNFIKKHTELAYIGGLSIFCIIMFFAFLGSYPLIDVDETRYVRIAQEMLESNNFLTPVINGNLFLEKPPLFFWLEDLSFIIFRSVNEWTARIPMGIVASFGVFATYFFGKKLVSQRFGFISALVLGSNIIYIILSHIAILDLLLSVTMMVSTYCGIMTLYSNEKANWLYWLGFYFFCGLSVLSKGLPGLIIPFATVFFAYLFSKKLKKLFDFRKIFLGFLLIALIVLPWHLKMYDVHGKAFIDEYVIKHHFSRFLNSEGINRKEPFWFYVPVIIIGFIPFISTILTVLAAKIYNTIKNFRTGFNFDLFRFFTDDVRTDKKFFNINILTFFMIFLFFSCASTKLPTYILPATFPLSYITAYIFEGYLIDGRYDKQIKISDIILISIFGISAIGAMGTLIVSYLINIDILKDIRPLLIAGMLLFGIYSIYNLRKINDNKCHFLYSSITMMAILTIILNLMIFKFIVSFGETDLINYSKYAKSTNKPLATFDFGERFSAIYYYGKHVDIQQEPNYEWLNEKLNKDYLIILKNKNMLSMPQDIKYTVINAGKKYSLIKKSEN